MTFNIDFIILNILLLYIFWKAGNNISNKGHYWNNANWCIFAFTIVQGCRFARGNDYHAYSEIFRNGITHIENPFFHLSMKLSKHLESMNTAVSWSMHLHLFYVR